VKSQRELSNLAHLQDGEPSTEQALYEQRMNELYADVRAGRCDFESAIERAVHAIVSRTRNWFTPRGREELEARVRVACANNSRLRSALGGG
jgi:hypothetical protein